MKQQENIGVYFTHNITAKASDSADIDNFTILTIVIVRLSYVIFLVMFVNYLDFLIQTS